LANAHGSQHQPMKFSISFLLFAVLWVALLVTGVQLQTRSSQLSKETEFLLQQTQNIDAHLTDEVIDFLASHRRDQAQLNSLLSYRDFVINKAESIRFEQHEFDVDTNDKETFIAKMPKLFMGEHKSRYKLVVPKQRKIFVEVAMRDSYGSDREIHQLQPGKQMLVLEPRSKGYRPIKISLGNQGESLAWNFDQKLQPYYNQTSAPDKMYLAWQKLKILNGFSKLPENGPPVLLYAGNFLDIDTQITKLLTISIVDETEK